MSSPSSEVIVHPGPAHAERLVFLPGRAAPASWALPRGATLLAALTAAVEASGADCAVALLDGVAFSGGQYVMPARSADGAHAAWYSPAAAMGAGRFEAATAVVGRRDGRWFAHCHALWAAADGGDRMGHLLNETVVLAEAGRAEAWLFRGGAFVAGPDPETGFPLFMPTGPGMAEGANAALLTLRPHEDLPTGLAAAAGAAGLASVWAFGVGSLIGAEFADAPAMASPISEVVLRAGACAEADGAAHLPLAAVDLEGRVHRGLLRRAPICVTGEFLLVRR